MDSSQSQDALKEQFQKAQKANLTSGVVKFNLDYISTYQLYCAVVAWKKEDSNVISTCLRSGGSSGDIALDFIYSGSRADKVLTKVIRPFFEQKLGGDYVTYYDFADEAIHIE